MARTGEFISIVVPVYNEAAVVDTFLYRLRRVLAQAGVDYEVIFVDDGSDDGTALVIGETQHRYPPDIKLLRLSRNFGHQAALLAGLDHAGGDCIVTLDGDLQHPPEVIPRLLERWRRGAQVVATRRLDDDSVSWHKRAFSWFYYRLFRRLSGLGLEPGMADFRLLDRQVVEAVRRMNERTVFLRGLLQWAGFPQEVVAYQAGPRASGASKYTPLKMCSLAINGITAFSAAPLRIAMVLGFIFSGMSFLYLAYALIVHIATDQTVAGWTSVIGSVLFLGGVQLICLGIIGEYVGRIFQEVKGRPHYLVQERLGFDHAQWPAADLGDRTVGGRPTTD